MSPLAPADREAVATVAPEARFDEPMARHTTLGVGGPADVFVEPVDRAALLRLLAAAASRRLPLLVVGAGSNLLVKDGGIPGVVVCTRRLRRIEAVGDTRVRVDAGVPTTKVLTWARDRRLGGLEFLAGVPGTVGGGLIMNAGTTLGEFKDVVEEVESARLADGAAVRRTNAECGFAYRTSALPAGEIVLGATLALRPRSRAEIDADIQALKERREGREPPGAGTAGSIFKNPQGDYAGRLIEQAGLKGKRQGGAEISPVHANWIVNAGGATAADMLKLIEATRAIVADKFGVALQLEVKVVGKEG